jgi:hypothetical protein
MDDYINGLKNEAELLISSMGEAQECSRQELDDIDKQIFKLMRQKEEKKVRVDGRLKELKRQADDKIKMYNSYVGVCTCLHRIV